jgi:hypothetical protein
MREEIRKSDGKGRRARTTNGTDDERKLATSYRGTLKRRTVLYIQWRPERLF